ncbi:SNF2-related protein [Pararobbsia alpina]|uniref:RNA polymerase-associated protein RapA n=1 Tax=Pararobbsia alpina TaxID=621374 RepID=A0A6S7BHN5_9BURK|nr:SNF2-related protein [Pararobbsia alpina]CAB3800658.1 RNA polymerase-associated protein RapA [Pararobbsia alpina]
MSLHLHAGKWRFLEQERAARYVDHYERQREKGQKKLAPVTTCRQFATAKAILDRLNAGQKGVILADDVGLGKTTVAAFCALVVAGSGGAVRILAPNEMMARRWRQELEVHLPAMSSFAAHLDLSHARRRLNVDIKQLRPGTIAVSTHQKVHRLNCDLLIVDEAHRTRSEDSNLGQRVVRQGRAIGNVLILTATPFSIDPKDFARLLKRVGGERAAKSMQEYSLRLADLWRGRHADSPKETADRLVSAARAAVEAMRPYVIRHGIDDLPAAEKKVFGAIEHVDASDSMEVSAPLLEAMLRADRALQLAQRCGAWQMKRRNDPRYHVAVGKLHADLTEVVATIAQAEWCNDSAARIAAHHSNGALDRLRTLDAHPKIAGTANMTRAIVDEGEKVLIFCDHHQPATELAARVAASLKWPAKRRSGSVFTEEAWSACWQQIFADELEVASNTGDSGQATRRLKHYIAWLMSDGVRSQIETWLEMAGAGSAKADLAKLLEKKRARGKRACDSIANHAVDLYKQMIDHESGSTRAILLQGDVARLPGSTLSRVAAVCKPGDEAFAAALPGVFFSAQPDTVLAVFNSPFGPDVLVTTDSLSEGVDLHRFCRHLIHHELDPSPIRTVQRNGRLRRVNCWAARTGQPIRVHYPSLRGTRDERLVEVMRHRIMQFDLLLGGVRGDVDAEDTINEPSTVGGILEYARKRLGAVRLGIV